MTTARLVFVLLALIVVEPFLRAAVDYSGQDRTGANFSGQNLSAATLTGTNLTNANLANSNLRDARLESATLTGATLTGATLTGARFNAATVWPAGFNPLNKGMFGPGVDLTAAVFPPAGYRPTLSLQGANLTNITLAENDLTGSDLTGATLTGANLRYVDATSTNLTNANLTNTNLTDIRFEGATLTGATLTGATLTRARFNAATVWPAGFNPLNKGMLGPGADLTGMVLPVAGYRPNLSLQGANLSGATLAENDLTGSNLTGANLTGANLRYVDATSTNLTNANLTNANLTDIRFEGATLTGATLTGATLTRARFNAATVWPAGFNPLNKGMLGPGVDLAGTAFAAGSYRPNLALQGANLIGVNLERNNIPGSNLSGANLTGANLRFIDATDTNLTNGNLTNADLTEAQLERATLTGATLTGATLTRARFNAATVWPAGFNPLNKGMLGPGADLSGLVLPVAGYRPNLSLQGANLSGATLAENDLTGSNLTGANLTGASLRNCNLTGVDFRRALLGAADLIGTDVTAAVFTGALYDNRTIWPTGFDPASAGAVNVSTALADGLVARYAFNGSGAEATSAALNITGAGTFGYVPDRHGRASRAVQLTSPPSNSVYYFTGTGPVLANSSSSVAFWVRKEYPTTGDWVFGLGGVGGNGLAMSVALDYNAGIRYSFWNNDFDLPNSLPGSAWQQVVATYDHTTRERKVYLNGVLLGTNTALYGFTGNTALKVGFTGITLDDLRFYNRVLSPSEVTALQGLTEELQVPQTITFAALPDLNAGAAPVPLAATASSGLPVTFSVVSGPATVSGSTLTLTGSGTVVVRAAQAGDATYAPAAPVERSFAVNAPPAITVQPVAQTIATGSAANLSVTATGSAPLSYQWRKSGVNLAGATNSSVALTSAQAADAGSYDVVVTNAAGTVTSAAAALRVTGVSAPGTGLIHHVPLAGGTGAIQGAGMLHVTIPPTQLVVADDRNHPSPGVYGPNRFGTAGRALVFDEVTKSYARLPALVDPAIADSFTISLWAFAEGERPTDFFGGNVLLMATHGGYHYGPGRAGVGLLLSRTEVGVTGHAANYIPVFINRPVQPGGWHHVVVSAQGRVLRLYVNGVLTGTNDQSASAYVLHPSAGDPHTHAESGIPEGGGIGGMIGHGGDSTNGIAYRGFKGRVSDFRLYNRGLSEAEVQQLFAAEFSVEPAYLPVITTQPVALTRNAGSSASFTVAADGTAPLTYQWRKGGANVTGATNATLSLPAVQAADAGTYDVVVTNAAGSTTSAGASLTVNTAPFITVQPLAQSAAAGASVTLSVIAASTPSPSYQWRKGGTALTGATNATLTLPAVAAADAGTYDVVVTNSVSAATSTGALLTVTGIASGDFVYSTNGSAATLTGYTGAGGAVSIPNALGGFPLTAIGPNAFLGKTTLTSVTLPATVTSIGAQAFGSCTGLTSVTIPQGVTSIGQGGFDNCPALLTLSLPASVTSIGSNAFRGNLGMTTITVDAANPAYSSDGKVLFNKARTTLIKAAIAGISGTYVVPATVTNIGLHAFRECTGLTSLLLPSGLTTIGADAFRGCTALGDVIFPASLNNIGPLAFDNTPSLRKAIFLGNAPALEGASAAFEATSLQVVYYLAGTTGWGATYSGVNTVVMAAPVITTQPQSQSVAAGSPVTFTVTATGTPAPVYQWRKGSADLTGATAASFSLAAAAAGDAATYSVVVSNPAGTVTSNAATLSVTLPVPVITSAPTATATVGTAFSYQITASNSPSSFAATGLPAGLSLNASTGLISGTATAAATASVSLTATNAGGTSTPQVLSLTVIAPPVISAPVSTREGIASGGALNLTLPVTGATSYQWRRNGFPVAAATSATYSVTNAQPARHAGWYQLAATNAAGTSVSAPIFVQVTISPAQVLQWGGSPLEGAPPAGLTRVSAVASKLHTSLALRADGTVAAWGGSNFGQASPPSGLTDVVAIAGAWDHGLALRSNGTVTAWGGTNYGQSTVPAGLTGVVAIAAGASHSAVAKADGTVVCWGWNAFGQCNVPAGLSDVVGVAAGYGHTLALKRDGTVVGWGMNQGELNIPAGLSGVIKIDAGDHLSVALKADGTVAAWGDNYLGKNTVPAGLAGVIDVAAGRNHVLALQADGTVVAWGDNGQGQTTVPAAARGAVALAGGSGHSVALLERDPLLFDGFAGNQLEATRWSTQLPFGDAAVTVANGALRSSNRGVLISQDTLQGPLVLRTRIMLHGDRTAADFFWKSDGAVANTSGLRLGLYHESQRITVGIANVTPHTADNWKPYVLPLDTWIDVLIVDSGSSVEVYLNGDPSPTLRCTYTAAEAAQLPAAGRVVFMSRESAYTGGSAASLDHLVISRGVSEVNSTSFQTGLVTQFAFAGSALDVSGNANHGTLQSGIAYGPDRFGREASALRFTGSSFKQFTTTVRQPVSDVYSVAQWFKLPPAHVDGALSVLAEAQTGTSPRSDKMLQVGGPSGGTLYFYLFPGTQVYLPAPTLVTDDRWHHVAAVLSPAGMALYLDGTLVARNSAVTTSHGIEGYWRVTLTEGAVDDLRVYNRALTAPEVRALYAMEKSFAPVINVQPQAQTVAAGSAATLSVTATGEAPLSYQWRKGGANVSGATNATLTLPVVQAADAGTYDVVVTNAAGSETAATATLTVNQLPQTISFAALENKTFGDPAFNVGATASSGLPVSFSVVSGPATLSGTTLTLTGAGTVTIAANQGGNATYAAAPVAERTFQVGKNWNIGLAAHYPLEGNANDVTPFANHGVVKGATLTTDRHGRANAAYRFSGLGATIEAPHAPQQNQLPFTLSLWFRSSAPLGQSAYIDAVGIVSKYYRGSWNGWQIGLDERSGAIKPWYLPTRENLIFSEDGKPPFESPGGLANGSWRHILFTVDGSEGILYLDGLLVSRQAWRGTPGPTAGSFPLVFGSYPGPGDFFYTGDLDDIRLYGRAFNAFEAQALYLDEAAPQTAPLITVQPQPQTVAAGSSVTFSVTATGTGPLSYQWRKDGAPIPGASLASFTLPNAVFGNSGQYDVIVSQAGTEVTSTPALLTVVSPAADFLYSVSNGSVTITGYRGTGGMVVIPPAIESLPVTSIGDGAFLDLASITSLTLPSTLTTIGSRALGGLRAAFAVASGNPAFAANGNLLLNSAGTEIIAGSALLSGHLTLPNSVRVIRQWAFHGCSGITGVTVPQGVTIIDDTMFFGCSSLADFVLPDSLEEFGFHWPLPVRQLNLPAGVIRLGNVTGLGIIAINVAAANPQFSSRDGVLYNKDQTVLISWPRRKIGLCEIPSSVVELAEGALAFLSDNFAEQRSGTRVLVPASVVRIGYNAFVDVFAEIHVDPANPAFSSAENVLFNKTGTQLIAASRLLSGAYIIPDGVTEILPNAFYPFWQFQVLTSLSLPASLPAAQLERIFGRLYLPYYFRGNAPSVGYLIDGTRSSVRYSSATSGWSSVFAGAPAAPYDPLRIISQPQSASVAVGATVQLSVATEGSLPESFQWRRNGVALSGATTRTLSLPALQAANVGSYDVIVTTPAERITSTPAAISISSTPQPQTITLAALANRTFGDAPFAVTATASSGLPVTLSVVSGPATLSSSTVTLTGTGTVTLRATQAGNTSYQAAEPVTQAFTVTAATPVLTWNPPASVPVGSVLGAAELNATATPAGGTFVYSPAAGTALNTSGLQTLTVTYTPAAAEAANYTTATANRTVNVTSGSGPSASLQLVGPAHYLPAGGTVTVNAGIAYSGLTPSALGYVLELPAGWSLASVGGTNVPNVVPTPGTTGALEFAYSTLPANAAAFTLVLNYPAGLTGTQTLTASATYRSPLQNLPITPVALARLDPPVITTQPAGTVVRTGSNLTLTVVASSLVTPTYQWRKDVAPLSGATNASLSLSGITLSQAGAYTVAVTNPAGTTVSASAQVVVLDVQAVHALSGAGYTAGGTVTITNTLTYSPGLTTLSWEVLPPTGWTYASGAGSEGGTKPAVGTADLLTWSWSTVPGTPLVFSYTLNVPAGTTGEKTLSALVRPGVAAGALQVLAQPDPLRLPPAGHHSADSNRDYQINLLELTRVIELYNTRNGINRTGAYRVQDTSEDGFAGEPTRAFGADVSLARHHSADTDRNGRLSLYELTRVIELYNHRESGARTGRYRIVHGSEDGFAPGN